MRNIHVFLGTLFLFLVSASFTFFYPTLTWAAACNIAAVEVQKPTDNTYANTAAKSYQNMTYNNYRVVRVNNLQELQSKVTDAYINNNCDCITELHIVGHGKPGHIAVGDGMDMFSAPTPNGHINGNKTNWQSVLTALSLLLCDRSTVYLVGCSPGACDKGSSKLYDIAKVMDTNVYAPVDRILGTKIKDYIMSGRWQVANSTSKPSHKAKNKSLRAPSRSVSSGDAYYCLCNNTTYSVLQDCVDNCQAGLSCYYGICDRVHTNNRWVQYAGNPVLTAGQPAAASIAATFDKQAQQRNTSARGSLVEHGPAVNFMTNQISGWDDYGVSQPAVIKMGPVYQAWYIGWDASNIDRIGFAESFDGVHWTKYAGNPVLHEGPAGSWDESGAYNPSVLVEETATGNPLYKMWYTGYSTTAKLARIGYATSPDGITWNKHPTYVLDVGPWGAWDDSGVGECHVIKDGNQYKMWYGGSDAQQWWRVGYATSPDGIKWTKHPGNPILREGPSGSWDEWAAAAPTVAKVNGIYHMFYGGIDSYDAARIGYALSADGIHWTKAIDNPHVMESLGEGGWDSANVYHATFFYDNNESLNKLYYRGTDGSNYGLGYTVTSMLMLDSSTKSSILDIISGVLGALREQNKSD